MSATDKPGRPDIYARITDRIIADLEQGVRPWQRPWNAEHMAGRIRRPLRHNGIAYQGINTLNLWIGASVGGYANPTWLTSMSSSARTSRSRSRQCCPPLP